MEINTDLVHARILELYKAGNWNVSRLAEAAGVPVASVHRYIKGEANKDPSFVNLCKLIKALGGSVDELIGNSEPAQAHATNTKYEAELYASLHYERRIKHIWQALFLALVFLFIGFLIFDLFNPNIGYIQYAAQMAAQTAQQNLSVVL